MREKGVAQPYPQGLFCTPLGAALLAGVLGAGIWIIPAIYDLKGYTDHLWECRLFDTAACAVLCSGRAIQERRL